MSSTSSKDRQPLPLADILRDLAVLRASDVDLARTLADDNPTSPEKNPDVQRSHEYVKEARTILRIHNRGDIDRVGEHLENVREGLLEVLKGLKSEDSSS